MRGWRAGGRGGAGGGAGLWTDGGMVKVQRQMLSIGRKIRTRWPIMQRTHRAFTSYQCLTYYCHSLLLFVLEKKDKQKEKTAGFSFSKRPIPWTLSSLALTTSGLRSLSPPDITLCSALVLPVLKPIGGLDHSQTPPPSQKVRAGGRRKAAAGGSGIAADRRLLWFRQEKKRHSV